MPRRLGEIRFGRAYALDVENRSYEFTPFADMELGYRHRTAKSAY